MHDTRQVLLRHLVERRAITDADIAGAHGHASERQACLIQSLIETGRLSHRELALARARVSGVPFVDLSCYNVSTANASLLPQAVAERYVSFPIFVVDGVACVAMIDPLDHAAIEAIRVATHHEVEPIVCDENALRGLIAQAYGVSEQAEQTAGPKSSLAPVASDQQTEATQCDWSLAERTMRDAIAAGASVLHACPGGPASPLRLRIDGTLKPTPCDAADPEGRVLTQQIKTLAGLDPARARVPQRARFQLMTTDGAIEADLSVLPTPDGEDLTVRFRPGLAAPLGIADLGMPDDIEAFFREAIAMPRGLLLVTGPLGSGRSTSIAAALRHRASSSVSILALKDHTNFGIPGVRRILIEQPAGFSSAEIIATASAHDPDIIAAGELSDASSAHAAFAAASRGCLVIATMDTDRAQAAVERLRHDGIAPDTIASSLIGVINQRLTGAGARFEALPMSPALARTDEPAHAAWTLRCAQARLGTVTQDSTRKSA